MARIFLICPVRGVPPETTADIAAYVAGLEAAGHAVHWPARDTDQTDTHGLAITMQNYLGIEQAEEVHVWHDQKSEGSRVDFGMVFALHMKGFPKRVVIANPDVVQPTPHKSFANVLLTLARQTAPQPPPGTWIQ